jgi:hypothetical protein
MNRNVYLYDFVTASNQLISGRMTNASASDISADGRFIAYRGELVVPPASIDYGLSGIYVYDRSNGTTMLLDGGQTKEITLDRRSFNPVFSGDGRTIVFQSRASNLISQDFNLSLDLFVFRFISASLIPDSDGVWVSWPYVSGNTYQVQFKESLDDPAWHDLGGSMTNSGNKAFLKDAKASAGQRFYRINAN